MSMAEVLDDVLGVAEAAPRHRRKQVMLDLIVQATQCEIGDPVAADVA
jgi:hypothetical protein